MLHGRDDEIAMLDRLLGDARSGEGGVLVLRGEAGIGKSALLRYAVAAATGSGTGAGAEGAAVGSRAGSAAEGAPAEGAAAGFRVLEIAGVRAESALPYAGLQALLSSAPAAPMSAAPASSRRPVDAVDRLPEPQARAIRGALGLESVAPHGDPPLGEPPHGEPRHAEPGGQGTGHGSGLLVGLAVLGLLSEYAEIEPLLVVDDAQWLDRESFEALQLAARRLAAEPVALLFAIREERAPDGGTTGVPGTGVPTGGAATGGAVTDGAASAGGPDTQGLPEVRVGGLGPEAARALMDERHPDLAPAARDRVLAEARGNPLALRELPAAPGSSGAAGIDRVLADRLRALPAPARRALTVAAADDTGSADIVLRALAELGGSPADLEPAEREGLVRVDGDRVVRFGHPLMRSAAYDEATANARLEAHRALAAVLDTPEQRGRRAWHRAAATVGTDERVAAELADAGEQARVRGGYSAVTAAYERAATLTPDPDRRVRRMLAAARAAADSAAYEHAARLLTDAAPLTDAASLTDAVRPDQAVAESPAVADGRAASSDRVASDDRAASDQATSGQPAGSEGRVDADLRAELARVWALLPEPHRPVPAHELLVSAALDRGSDDELWSEAARAAWTANDFEVLHRIAGCRDALPRAGALAAAALATNRLAEGEYGGIAELRALLADPTRPYGLCPALSVGAQRTGRHASGDGATRQRDDLRDAALRARLLLIVGDIVEADRLAGAVEYEARRSGAVGLLPQIAVVRAWCARYRGALVDARVAASEGQRLATDIRQPVPAAELSAVLAELAALRGDEEEVRERTADPLNRRVAPASVHAAAALGLLDLGLGRYDAAHQRLRDVLGGERSMGVPAALPILVEAAHRSGRPDEAREALGLYERWAEEVDRPWARAVVARCRGLVADDPDAYERAAGPEAFPLDRAWAELLDGERLRRERQPARARSRLRSALEAYERLGAHPWAERARAEMRATGETRAARDHEAAPAERLTPQELQVAQSAASGGSNREIGAKLFLSPRTVGYHLSKAYRKLGVRSRTELAGLLTVSAGQDGG